MRITVHVPALALDAQQPYFLFACEASALILLDALCCPFCDFDFCLLFFVLRFAFLLFTIGFHFPFLFLQITIMSKQLLAAFGAHVLVGRRSPKLVTLDAQLAFWLIRLLFALVHEKQ